MIAGAASSASRAATAMGILVGFVALQGCQSSTLSSRSAAPVATQSATTPSGITNEPSAELRTMVDDGNLRGGAAQFRYFGHWEHASRRNDGRSLGTSSRSFHVGDEVAISFVGTQIRVYGVRGARGGYGAITLDGRSGSTLPDFYAPTLRPGTLVYESPVLLSGPHALSIAVTGRHEPASHGAYVNIDYAAITSAAPGRMR
jgi:hypothetical protein